MHACPPPGSGEWRDRLRTCGQELESLRPAVMMKGLITIRPFFLVRPAGRTCLEVKVLYPPGKGKD